MEPNVPNIQNQNQAFNFLPEIYDVMKWYLYIFIYNKILK
jgi:hypothetical protein